MRSRSGWLFRGQGQWADYDNDGDQDIFVLHPDNAQNELFRNDADGVFSPVGNRRTRIAALHPSATWVDHGPGWLAGLFVTSYTENNSSGISGTGGFNLGQPTSGLAVGVQSLTTSSHGAMSTATATWTFCGAGANGQLAPDFYIAMTAADWSG